MDIQHISHVHDKITRLPALHSSNEQWKFYVYIFFRNYVTKIDVQLVQTECNH